MQSTRLYMVGAKYLADATHPEHEVATSCLPEYRLEGGTALFCNPAAQPSSRSNPISQMAGQRFASERGSLPRRDYQILTRFSGVKKSLSAGCNWKAAYHASIFRTTPFTRFSPGLCGSVNT